MLQHGADLDLGHAPLLHAQFRVAGERQLPAPPLGKRWRLDLVGVDGSTPTSKDRPGGRERPAGRFPGRIAKSSRDSPVRSRFTGVGSEISGCPALRFLAVAHSRRRGGQDYGHPCHSRRARADRSCAGKIPAWAACAIRVSYMDCYMVWRFWRFSSSSNLRWLSTPKAFESRLRHHRRYGARGTALDYRFRMRPSRR